jgi:two-component system cell cycle sensor histidine kinase/response regulator CckA
LKRIVPEDRTHVLSTLAQARDPSGTGFLRSEYRLRHPNGQVRWLSTQLQVFFSGEGAARRARHVIGAVVDVTEQQRQREALEQLRQAQKMEAVGQLAGGIAHDFNNLLTIIFSATGLLKVTGNTEQRSLLEQVDQAAQRASALTAHLLAFSRKQVMRPRSCDLTQLVSDHCTLLARTIGERIQLVAELDPKGAPAHVDPNLIEQVLMNLVLNARDAMPRGGSIVVQLETVIADSASPTQPPGTSGSFVRIRVRDTGTGIQAEYLPHLFEPFFTTKEPGKGTGLGLATAYGIVEQHGGWIEVSSEHGSGTTFQIYLPRAAGVATRSGRTNTEPVRGGDETILLVEDEPVVRELVCADLERCGYRVHQAGSGDAALEVWREHHEEIALLLTDVVMPGSLSGKELGEKLRAEDERLKVVYMSGYGAHRVGSDPSSSFVQKPFDLATLAPAVREQLDKD